MSLCSLLALGLKCCPLDRNQWRPQRPRCLPLPTLLPDFFLRDESSAKWTEGTVCWGTRGYDRRRNIILQESDVKSAIQSSKLQTRHTVFWRHYSPAGLCTGHWLHFLFYILSIPDILTKANVELTGLSESRELESGCYGDRRVEIVCTVYVCVCV